MKAVIKATSPPLGVMSYRLEAEVEMIDVSTCGLFGPAETKVIPGPVTWTARGVLIATFAEIEAKGSTQAEAEANFRQVLGSLGFIYRP